MSFQKRTVFSVLGRVRPNCVRHHKHLGERNSNVVETARVLISSMNLHVPLSLKTSVTEWRFPDKIRIQNSETEKRVKSQVLMSMVPCAHP